MINKKSMTAAFTLIELLVVITIIGILAGIALPVFNTVQVKGSQTKGLAQAKQIGLALRLFAGDNDGAYPAVGTPAELANIAFSNDAFAALFPQYLTSETIFANKLVTGSKAPDNAYDANFTGTRTRTLAKGENVYGYMTGLTDASNPNSPLVFDSPANTQGQYSNTTGAAGAVWGGTKAICIRLDNSGAVENLLTTAPAGSTTNPVIKGNSKSGTVVNLLNPGANDNLGVGNEVKLADL